MLFLYQQKSYCIFAPGKNTTIFYFCMCTVQKFKYKADQQNPCQGLYDKVNFKFQNFNKNEISKIIIA